MEWGSFTRDFEGKVEKKALEPGVSPQGPVGEPGKSNDWEF
jgi:hypothetical protein